MKHGDKAKKTAKAKGTIKKAIAKVAAKVKASQSSRKEASPKAAATPKSSAPAKPAAGGNGKSVPRNGGVAGFSNPVVANAFKRAVKKYPTAFRRLTD